MYQFNKHAIFLFIVIIFISLDSSASNHSPTVHPAWSQRMADTVMQKYPEAWSMRKSDGRYRWSYVQGLVLKGINGVYGVNGNKAYFNYVKAYADHYIDAGGRIKTYHLDEYNIDSINPGKILFPLYESTKNEAYLIAMKQLMSQLDWHPRTSEGVFWHKLKYPWQIWLDGLYMAAPYYAQYESVFNKGDGFNDIAVQFLVSYDHLYDEKTRLLFHGWDESRVQTWANKNTGRSPSFWSRSIGWYTMALVDTLEYFPKTHPKRKELESIFAESIAGVVQYQDSSGLWYQVTDQGSRKGNYLEASGSLMFIYSIAKGVRLGLLPNSYLDAARKGFDGVINQFVKIDNATGLVELTNVCRSAGLGGDPYRDGTFEYYINEDVVTSDAHGVGAFILASLEIEQSQ